MPTMDNWEEGSKPFKGLLIGDQGTGKTAATSYLANEGYELFYADFDDGLAIIPQIIKSKEARARIHYKTLTDKLHTIGDGVYCDGCPEAASTFQALLSGWVDGSKSYGPLHTWGPERVLVIDSLTRLGESLMRYHLFLNGRNGKKPFVGDWGDAMENMQAILSLLYSTSIKCNVIVNAHISYITRDTGEDNAKGDDIKVEKGYPSALGSKLPPKVGGYFNNVLMVKSMTIGQITTRQIITQSDGLIELKCPAIGLPHRLPHETGMRDIFRALGIKRPGSISMLPPGSPPPADPATTGAAA